jgi:HAD superfamily hydrolase (TIGR01509 family)
MKPILLKHPIVIPEGPFEAYLYDCDGTIADSMEAHIEAWVQELNAHGVPLDGKLIHELAGMPATNTVDEINRRYGSKLDPKHIAQAKEDRFYDHFLHRIQPIPEMVEHLKASAGHVKIGVVSGGRTRIVKHTIELLGIKDLVQALVCAEDVKHGKPHPEPFLLAAAQLNVDPSRCLVFEDADLGIESARRAGMKWVRVVT